MFSTIRICLALAVTALLIPEKSPGQQPAAVAKPENTEAHDKAIRANVDAFVAAYNAHDAAAVAALFLPQAQVIDVSDSTIQGRENIERLFAGLFEENPEATIEVEIESIRFVGSSLAFETGTTVTTAAPGETPERGRYNVLHVLLNGTWSMGVVRDLPAEPNPHDRLESLAWLIGDWVDESRGGLVRTSCRWSDNENFLIQEISVHQPGREPLSMSQRIGWDPLGKRFKSWVFDAAGGYGEGNWTPTEAGWVIKSTSVTTDGTIASATNHLTPLGPDRYLFQSVDRVLGNDTLPPVEVVVVRQPPEPGTQLTVTTPQN